MAVKDGDSGGDRSTMESVLSLNDGRWLRPAEESCPPLNNGASEDNFQLGYVRQPSPPPVLAQMKHEILPISPSKVADPRPGPAKSSPDGIASSNSYQHLHIVGPLCCFAFYKFFKTMPNFLVTFGSFDNFPFHV